jgi:hypothetical protein
MLDGAGNWDYALGCERRRAKGDTATILLEASMQNRPGHDARNAIHVPEATVKFLSDSTAAGNGHAVVALKGACPTCGEPGLRATARFREAEVVAHARVRRYDIVATCPSGPCKFTSPTSGKFALR